METTNNSELITDNHKLVSVTNEYGRELPIYDDGDGPLWIFRDTMGIQGIVRATSWEKAFEICQDEFYPEASETIEELRKEYNYTIEHIKIIRTNKGEERPATKKDYPKISEMGVSKWEFVRWETRTAKSEDPNAFYDNELFNEQYGFRPSGPNVRDRIGHGIYQKDLGGESLDLLTKEMIKDLRLSIIVKGVE